jgi:hypothetical protein
VAQLNRIHMLGLMNLEVETQSKMKIAFFGGEIGGIFGDDFFCKISCAVAPLLACSNIFTLLHTGATSVAELVERL